MQKNGRAYHSEGPPFLRARQSACVPISCLVDGPWGRWVVGPLSPAEFGGKSWIKKVVVA